MNKAFTLLEISIILLIIGVITGIIILSNEFVQQSKFRALQAQIADYESAINFFTLKYNAFPGDYENASEISLGFSGNGDTIIDNSTEQYYFHQHLGNAGLVPGSYTGIGGGLGFDEPLLAENVAKTRFNGVGLSIYNTTILEAHPFYTPDFVGEFLVIGTACPNCLLVKSTNGLWLNPQEAKSFDTKFDDGLPTKGKILGISNDNLIRCNLPILDHYIYDLNENGANCYLNYKIK